MNSGKTLLALLAFTCSFVWADTLPVSSDKYREIEVKNPLDIARTPETITVNFADISSVPGITADNVAVYCFESQQLIVSQVITQDDKKELIFQSGFGPSQSKKFAVLVKPEGMTVPTSELRAHAGFYEKRDDDVAWENDKMAARMYGRALEWETISCGIDLWCKEVPRPIVEQKYNELFDKKLSYHESRGIGGDYYKVGPTLGCGGNTIYRNGKLYMPDHNFLSHKILANGPIRGSFEIVYDKWNADGMTVSETMRVTADLGSYLCKVEATYNSDQPSLPVAMGVVLRETGGQYATDANAGWAAYWQPKEDFGTIFCGIAVPSNTKVKAELADNHILLSTNIESGKTLTYYTGGSWDKTGEITDLAAWKQYLANMKTIIDNPLITVVKPTQE